MSGSCPPPALSLVTISTAGIALFVFLVAACAINRTARLWPAWTDVVGWLAAALFLASGLGIVSDANVFTVVGIAAFLVWCVWIVAVSVAMLRPSR